MNRGTLVWAAPDPHIGREQARRRPVLIVSSDDALASIRHLVTTVPLTTREKSWSTRVRVSGPKTGLDRPTWAICEQVRTISVQRLGAELGVADDATMGQVDRVLRYLLNLL